MFKKLIHSELTHCLQQLSGGRSHYFSLDREMGAQRNIVAAQRDARQDLHPGSLSRDPVGFCALSVSAWCLEPTIPYSSSFP